jgi:hypothetical protein
MSTFCLYKTLFEVSYLDKNAKCDVTVAAWDCTDASKLVAEMFQTKELLSVVNTQREVICRSIAP